MKICSKIIIKSFRVFFRLLNRLSDSLVEFPIELIFVLGIMIEATINLVDAITLVASTEHTKHWVEPIENYKLQSRFIGHFPKEFCFFFSLAT